jgi:hypothetical protein
VPSVAQAGEHRVLKRPPGRFERLGVYRVDGLLRRLLGFTVVNLLIAVHEVIRPAPVLVPGELGHNASIHCET